MHFFPTMDIETCRICAGFYVAGEIEFINLFQPAQEDLQNELNFIISEVNAWQLNIYSNDGLPQRVCSNCFAKFSTINKFRKECETAQNLLRKALDSQIQQSYDTAAGLAQQFFHDQSIDSNDNIIKYIEPMVDKTLLINSNELEKLNSDAAIVSSELALNCNITFDQNTLTNIPPIANGGDMATETYTNTYANIDVSNEGISVQENQINDKIEDNPENQDLEEMLSGSVIPKNLKSQNVRKVSVKAKVDENKKNDSTDDEEVESLDEKPAQRIANFPFACNYCYCPSVGPISHLIFKSSDDLSQHFFDMHDPELPYPCPKCPDLFSSCRKRNNHIFKTHTTGPRQGVDRCLYCQKIISTPQKSHEFSCSYISDWRCKICDRNFRNTPLKIFRNHQSSHYAKPKYCCEICNSKFMRPATLEMHRRIHAESCTECKEYFSSYAELKEHNFKVHNGQQLFRCKYCQHEFLSFSYLNRHMESKHPTKYKKYNNTTTCSNCGIVFPSKVKLYHHEQRPKDEKGRCILQIPNMLRSKLISCEHCTKRFTSKEELDIHLQLHEARLRPYKCFKCPAQCISAYELKQHLDEVHCETKSFSCDKCNESFGCEKDLESHKLNHETSYFNCSVGDCNAIYHNENDLSEHIRINHELVSCECCNQIFTRHQLKEHQNSVTCATNMNKILQTNEDTIMPENNSVSMSCDNANNNVFVQFIADQQKTLILKENVELTQEVIPQEVMDFIQTDENVIHAPDVPMTTEDYFISSLLEPDHEIIVS